MKKCLKNSLFIFVLVFCLCCIGFLIIFISSDYSNNNIDNSGDTNSLKVHFIDVGQGDATFIELPNNKCMLIDAGERSYGGVVKKYISNLGYSEVNYVIGTHPHTDHIGGLEEIVSSFDINYIYLPSVSSNSKTFENLISTISDKKLKINKAKAGISLFSDDNISGYFVAPVNDSYSNLNNYSATLLLKYNNVKFLFMGDAEVLSENEITDNIDVDIIKIGHHGSNTSSGIDFVNRVSARYGIISVGKNSYGHPNDEVIKRWVSNGASIYRTDINGNIIVNTDGNIININAER